jgi:hypothetical protein
MAKGKGNGGVEDVTVEILKDIRTDLRAMRGDIRQLAEGQEEMRGDLRIIKERLASVLDYTLHRYEDHERRLRQVEEKLTGR